MKNLAISVEDPFWSCFLAVDKKELNCCCCLPSRAQVMVLWGMVLGMDRTNLCSKWRRRCWKAGARNACLVFGPAAGKQCVTSWSDQMNTSEPYWAVQACGGRVLPIAFFTEPVSAKPLNVCPHEQVQTFALSSPSGCEAVQAGSSAAVLYTLMQLNSDSVTHTHHTHKRHFPAARGSHLVGPNQGRASTRLPVPICVDVSDVNMHPVNFHVFVIASPASTEASHSRPPSWSCWERLDLWQRGLFPARSGAVASLHWEASSRGKPGWEETQADHPMSPF